MSELVENSASVADVAKVLKSTAAAVEADANELSLFVGVDWAGRPALSVADAAAYVSGAARRDADHADAHRRWRAGSEDWEADREAVRRAAYADTFDAVRRRGVGDPQAAHEAAGAASAAVVSFEKATPAPVFGVVESPPRLSERVKELLSK